MSGRMFINMNTLQIITKPARPVKPAYLKEAARVSRNALARAKRLAAVHGVDIERESADAYWVTHRDLTDTPNDPCEGSHFCSDGTEVLQTVERYAEFLTQQKAGK